MNLLTIICILLISVSVVGQTTADLILVNGNVRTMDRSQPQAQAVASLNGRIIAVGTSAEINGLAGPNTKIIDAKGKLILPGFNDSHVHFTAIGNLFSHLDLRGAQSEDTVLAKIAEFVKVLPNERWLLG